MRFVICLLPMLLSSCFGTRITPITDPMPNDPKPLVNLLPPAIEAKEVITPVKVNRVHECIQCHKSEADAWFDLDMKRMQVEHKIRMVEIERMNQDLQFRIKFMEIVNEHIKARNDAMIRILRVYQGTDLPLQQDDPAEER